jgi:hypothetical protein
VKVDRISADREMLLCETARDTLRTGYVLLCGTAREINVQIQSCIARALKTPRCNFVVVRNEQHALSPEQTRSLKRYGIATISFDENHDRPMFLRRG